MILRIVFCKGLNLEKVITVSQKFDSIIFWANFKLDTTMIPHITDSVGDEIQENLVIELKAPKVVLTKKVLRQIEDYIEYAILTDEISRAWSGMSTRQYKNLKGMKKENLRDNMTTLELVLNMLAEATTTEISKQKLPETLSENIDVARAGGKVAGDARKAIEAQTGVPVITARNASQLGQVVADMLEETSVDSQNKESDK